MTRMAVHASCFFALISCNYSPKLSDQELARENTSEAYCAVTATSGESAVIASSPAEFATFLKKVVDLNSKTFIADADWNTFRKFVITYPAACDNDASRTALAAASGVIMEEHNWSLTKPYKFIRPPFVMQTKVSLDDFHKSISAEQRPMSECSFAMPFRTNNVGDPGGYIRFRNYIEESRAYGVPILYSFMLEGRLMLILRDHCDNGTHILNGLIANSGVNHDLIETVRQATPDELSALRKATS